MVCNVSCHRTLIICSHFPIEQTEANIFPHQYDIPETFYFKASINTCLHTISNSISPLTVISSVVADYQHLTIPLWLLIKYLILNLDEGKLLSRALLVQLPICSEINMETESFQNFIHFIVLFLKGCEMRMFCFQVLIIAWFQKALKG